MYKLDRLVAIRVWNRRRRLHKKRQYFVENRPTHGWKPHAHWYSRCDHGHHHHHANVHEFRVTAIPCWMNNRTENLEKNTQGNIVQVNARIRKERVWEEISKSDDEMLLSRLHAREWKTEAGMETSTMKSSRSNTSRFMWVYLWQCVCVVCEVLINCA